MVKSHYKLDQFYTKYNIFRHVKFDVLYSRVSLIFVTQQFVIFDLEIN